jgi:hypothetical protein
VITYRTGNHNPALVYRYDSSQPGDRGVLVAVFVDKGGEDELDALHFVRAMNATLPGCTCPLVCSCGELPGTTVGCETCAEHVNECGREEDES